MKWLLAILFMVFLPCSLLAAPFLTCDSQPGVDYYVVSGLPLDGYHSIPDATGALKFDLETLPPGSYTVRAKACQNLWGCSADSSPLDFTRPSGLSAPGNIKLSL